MNSRTPEEKEKQLKAYMSEADLGEEIDEDDAVANSASDIEAAAYADMPKELVYREPIYPVPVQDEFIERSYPFFMTLTCRFPVARSLLMDKTVFRDYTAKLTVHHRDLRKFIPIEQDKLFQELVGRRYDSKKDMTSFSCNRFFTLLTNKNRVFQLFDYALWESRKLYQQFSESGQMKLEHKVKKHVPKNLLTWNPNKS